MTKWMAGISLLILGLAGPAIGAGPVPLFGTAEIVLAARDSYDGRAGEPKPFDREVTARVTSPTGRLYTVPGFFDGDGDKGPVGRVFKVRVAADEAGTWRWTAAGDVPGVAGREGSFEVAGGIAGFFGRGPVVADPERRRSFRQRNGGPVFLVGKFLDVAAPERIRFSHTLFSELRSEGDREALLARHLGMRLN